MSQENWVTEQERNRLLRGIDKRQLSARMLEISPTNRVVTERGAKLAVAVRQLNVRLGNKWDWLTEVADMCEEYQLTIGSPLNSRKAFIEALKAELNYQESGVKRKELI